MIHPARQAIANLLLQAASPGVVVDTKGPGMSAADRVSELRRRVLAGQALLPPGAILPGEDTGALDPSQPSMSLGRMIERALAEHQAATRSIDASPPVAPPDVYGGGAAGLRPVSPASDPVVTGVATAPDLHSMIPATSNSVIDAIIQEQLRAAAQDRARLQAITASTPASLASGGPPQAPGGPVAPALPVATPAGLPDPSSVAPGMPPDAMPGPTLDQTPSVPGDPAGLLAAAAAAGVTPPTPVAPDLSATPAPQSTMVPGSNFQLPLPPSGAPATPVKPDLDAIIAQGSGGDTAAVPSGLPTPAPPSPPDATPAPTGPAMPDVNALIGQRMVDRDLGRPSTPPAPQRPVMGPDLKPPATELKQAGPPMPVPAVPSQMPVPPVTDHPTVGQRYAIKPGDTLWDIAKRAYGDPRLWPLIAQANPQIKNPNLIYHGRDQIVIPPPPTPDQQPQSPTVPYG